MPFTTQYVREKSNTPLRASAMIWLDERTVVPETTPIVPFPSVRTGWSTPGTSIFWVQFSLSTQNWNSPGLSPRSAPASKVTTTATLTGMGSAPSRAAQRRNAGSRARRRRLMGSAVGRRRGRRTARPPRPCGLGAGRRRLGRPSQAGGGGVQHVRNHGDVVDGIGPAAQLDGLAHAGKRLGGIARVDRNSTRLNSSHLGISY